MKYLHLNCTFQCQSSTDMMMQTFKQTRGQQQQIFCTVVLSRLTWQAHFQLCVSLQTACTVDYIHQVDGGPSEGHPVATEPLTELLRLSTQLLQLLLILQISIPKSYWNK